MDRSLRWRLWGGLEVLTDRLCDLPDTRWRWLNDLPFESVDLVKRAVCRVAGHLPESDQCGIPAHDHCLYCHTRTPNQAKR